MTTPPDTRAIAPSLGEEIASSVSHGIGLLAALAASPLLIVNAARHGGVHVVGASVFAATLILLYLASTVYHALPPNTIKRVFRVLDHSAIFLLIAGTYTPFSLGVLRGVWGWTILGLVWSLALAGVTLKAVGFLRYPILSTALYIAMGWIALIAIQPIVSRVPVEGIVWLLAGGLAYTGGVAFYAAHRVPYAHLAWHLCVLAGSVCHFVAVFRFSA
jgi:hemolysin III